MNSANPSIDVVGLAPEFTLTATLVVAFVLDLVLGERSKASVIFVSILGTLAAGAAAVVMLANGRAARLLDGAYVVDDFSLVAKAVVLASVALVLLIGVPGQWRGEYVALVLSSALGMVLVASSRDLITFFVAFELLAVPGYMLAGWNKRSRFGHEAALKYYLLGVVATAIFLYGLSFLYGLVGSAMFSDIAAYFNDSANADLGLARLALLLVLVGMAFKISAVPFHFWAPDTYQGAPIAVAAFLSIASKAAGMVALLVLILFAFPGAYEVWGPMLWVLAAVSMTVGNLIALRQSDLVRLLAYSSIAQAGYLLIPLAVMTDDAGSRQVAVDATFAYLVVYIVTNVAAFAVAALLLGRENGLAEQLHMDRLHGLFARNPVAAMALTVAMLSLAGIPPLAGWFAKFVVLDAAVEAATTAGYVLAVIAVVNTAIGLVYYALVVRRMWLSVDEGATETAPAEPVADADTESIDSTPSTSRSLKPTLYATAAATVVLGVLPGLVTAVGSASSLAQ